MISGEDDHKDKLELGTAETLKPRMRVLKMETASTDCKIVNQKPTNVRLRLQEMRSANPTKQLYPNAFTGRMLKLRTTTGIIAGLGSLLNHPLKSKPVKQGCISFAFGMKIK
jgi:hypothetical protein